MRSAGTAKKNGTTLPVRPHRLELAVSVRMVVFNLLDNVLFDQDLARMPGKRSALGQILDSVTARGWREIMALGELPEFGESQAGFDRGARPGHAALPIR